MTSRIRHVTIDCHDTFALATFWAATLGGTVHPDDHPGDPEVLVTAGEHAVLFERVPEGKVVKNRVHLDLQPQDRTRDEEVARLRDLGASVVADRRNPDGTGWVVMGDPEGNEFCVERSAAERGGA